MLIYVPLKQVEDNPFQRRVEYGDIKELAADIYRHKHTRPDTLGLQQVPNGRLMGDDGYPCPFSEELLRGGELMDILNVQLEFGHRRFRAFQHLAETYPEFYKIPVFIRDLSDDEMLDGVWSENRQRRNLSAVEEAELLQLKLDTLESNQREVAKSWGLARSTVANRLRLLTLPQAVKDANRRGELSERQCLSLAPVVQLAEMVADDDIGWGTGVGGDSWVAPKAPDDYIEYVIDHPDATSEEIRGVHKRMLDHAGVKLPSVIAKFDCTEVAHYYEGDYVTQPMCKGCPLRVNQHCLDASCIEVKKEWFAEVTLQTVAEELDLPASDILAHFKPFNDDWDLRQNLKAYWDAGERDDLVVGWIYENHLSTVRPFHKREWISGDELFDGDGRAAIAIGHKNPNALPSEVDSGEDAPDIADRETIDDWGKQVSALRKTAVSTARSHMKDALSCAVADFAPLIALIQSPAVESTDDTAVLIDNLLEFLWTRGRWDESRPSTAIGQVGQINGMLRRADIDPLPEPSFAERAAVWLSEWYEHREYSWYEEYRKRAAAEIETLCRELVESGNEIVDPEVLQLSWELNRAAADAQRLLGEDEDGEPEVEIVANQIVHHISVWIFDHRPNDIAGQLKLMQEIHAQTNDHLLWESMAEGLDNCRFEDIYTAVLDYIKYLEGLTVKTAVSEDEAVE